MYIRTYLYVSAEDRRKKGKEKERETRKGVMEIYDPLFTQIMTSMCMFFLMTHSIHVCLKHILLKHFQNYFYVDNIIKLFHL
jgi:hypothetical protein